MGADQRAAAVGRRSGGGTPRRPDELVGRAPQQARLRTAIGRAAVTAVVGPAGIGKSALVASVLAERDHLAGEALSLTSDVPYSTLERALGTRLAGTAEEVADRALGILAGRPLLVENLHWLDRSSRQVLGCLVGRNPLVVTSRRAVTDGDLLAGAEVLALGPLTAGEAARLARRLHPQLDAGGRAALVARSSGNPLLLHALAGTGVVVTPTLQAALAERLAGLDPEQRRSHGLLALLGRPAPLGLLEGHEASLAGSDLVRTAPEGLALGHDLVTEAVLRVLAEDERRDLHALLARRLDDAEAAEHELAAGNLAAARRRAEAAAVASADVGERGRLLLVAATAAGAAGEALPELWVRAAAALVDGGRWVDALEALARLDGLPADLAVDAALQQGRALWFSGEVDAARRSFERAEQGVPADDRGRRVRIAVERAYLEVRDRCQGSVGIAEQALAVAEDAGHEVLRARSTLGAALLYDGRPGWEELLVEVVDEAFAAGEVELASTAMHHLVSGLGFHGRIADGSALCRRQLDAIEHLGFRALGAHLRAALLLNDAVTSIDLDGVLAGADEFVGDHPLFRNLGQVRLAKAVALVDLGRLDEAAAACEEMARFVRTDEDVVYHASAQAELAWSTGDAPLAHDALARSRPAGDAWFGLRLLVEAAVAHLLFEVGEPVEVDLPSFSVPTFWPALHEIEGLRRAGEGDAPGAIEELDRATAAWEATGMPRWAVRSGMAAAAIARRRGSRHAAARRRAAGTLARRHGLLGPLRRFGLPARAELTAKEEEVLRRVAQGMTTGQVAAELGISPDTVDQHVESSCRKLGATTRLEAAAMVDRP